MFQMEPDFRKGPSTNLDCSSATGMNLYALRVQQIGGKPVSVNLASTAIASSLKYVDHTSGDKVYGMFELSSSSNDCYYHTNYASINPFFMVVIQKGSNPASQCKITRIITNLDLQPCGGTSTEDFFTFFKPYHNSAVATNDAFSSIIVADNYINIFRNYNQLWNYLPSYSLSDIDERMVEAMVLGPLAKIDYTEQPTMFFYDVTARTNDWLTQNTFTTQIEPAEYIKRLVWDDLPGYYLEVYNPGTDKPEDFLQKISKIELKERTFTHSTHLQMYIQKPASIAVGETHIVEYTLRPAVQASGESKFNLKQFVYQIQVTRTSTELQFQVKRSGSNRNYLALSYSGGTDFIYFSFTV